MTREAGWGLARENYQEHGYVTDTDLPRCKDEVTTTGWLEAYRNYWITNTVPPTVPATLLETPWPMSTWDPLPWGLAADAAAQRVNMPDVIGLPAGEAVATLEALELIVVLYYTGVCEPGTVCTQDPEPGASVGLGCETTLVAGKDVPPDYIEVRDVVGVNVAQAVLSLIQDGLRAEATAYIDCGRASSEVCVQDPVAGSWVAPDSLVRLWPQEQP